MSGLDATISLLGVAWELVRAILDARGEVRNAKEKTNKLLETVEKAELSLRHLNNRPGDQPLWDGLDARLKVLGEDLCLALEKVQSNVESNERREAGNQLVATARSVIGRGASQQNKKTQFIISRLEEALATIDREALYFIAGAAASYQTQLQIRSLPDLRHPEHKLVTRMQILASKVDETLTLAVAVSQDNSWAGPTNSKAKAEKKPVGIRLHRRKRDAREGGYEVSNRTKVRFSMSANYGKWYFYVLSFDRWENAEPSVLFPKSAQNVENSVSSERPRVFPNKDKHSGDLVSLKLERSVHVPDDEEGQVSIFLVLTTTLLQKDGARGQITIQDIEQHMNSVEEDELIVKHMPFDIAK